MRILVDTNVLVRSIERKHPVLRISRDALLILYERGDELCITPQNVSEFWNVCTRPTQANGLGNNVDAAALAAIVLAYRLDAILTFNADDFKRYPITILDPALF